MRQHCQSATPTWSRPLAFAKYIALSARSTNRSKLFPLVPQGHAHTRGDARAVVVGFGYRFPDPLCHRLGGSEVDSGQEHDELLSAVTDDDVTRPRAVDY